MKKIHPVPVLLVLSLLFTSCGRDFPLKEYPSLDAVRNAVKLDLKYPDLSKDTDGVVIRFYSVSTISATGTLQTGYSVQYQYYKLSDQNYSKKELRGIDLGRAGLKSEDTITSEMKTVIPDTELKQDNFIIHYAAYKTKYDTAEEIASQKGITNTSGINPEKSNNPYYNDLNFFETLVFYVTDSTAHYSIIYSGFESPTDKDILKIMIEDLKNYFNDLLR